MDVIEGNNVSARNAQLRDTQFVEELSSKAVTSLPAFKLIYILVFCRVVLCFSFLPYCKSDAIESYSSFFSRLLGTHEAFSDIWHLDHVSGFAFLC